MKCQWCRLPLGKDFQAIYSKRLDSTLAFCPLCYAKAINHYYVVCANCGAAYWQKTNKVLYKFTFAYADTCGWCWEEGYIIEKIVDGWRKVWNSQLLLSQLSSSDTGFGEVFDD